MNFFFKLFADLGKGNSLQKVFLSINIVFSQFFFLILISYVGNDNHILGEIGYRICHFLINSLLGISAFAIPLGWFYLSFALIKNQRNISEIIRHLAWFSLMFFWFNVLLLNTSIINTPWAGLLPKFFHALVSRAFTQNFELNFLVVTFEATIFIILAFLLSRSYLNKSFKEIFLLVKTVFMNGIKIVKKLNKNFGNKKLKEPSPSQGKNFFLKGFFKNWIQKWNIFWTDLFGFINRVDDRRIQECLGENIPSLSTGNFTLMRFDHFSSPHLDLDNLVATKNPEKQNSFSETKEFEEALTFHRFSKKNLKQENLGENKQVSSLIDSPTSEIIDLSLGKFFNKINGKNEEESEKVEKEAIVEGNDLSMKLPAWQNDKSEKEIESMEDEKNEKLFEDKTDIVPSVINSKTESQDGNLCLAELEKLVFSDNPSRSKTLDVEIKKTCEKLESTIQEFSINTQVVNVSQGPVITQYELTLEPGVHISKIVNLSDNIALSLAAESVRIVAPIPGKAVIGIEIPNKIREMVTLRDIVDKKIFQESQAILPIALGASISGKPVITDLTSTPHLLVAGATGSGKSVCVNSIICSLLLRCNPSQVRFLMIDPKMVELNIYNDIPHLLAPVITDPQKAALTLKWAISEMEARYRFLERFGVRSIKSYNQMVKKQENFEYESLPYIVIIIDEFADLMMVAKKEIEDSVSRLAAMSRAIGIHLLLATQRPSVDVITGVIKANFPSRVAFQVSSKIDSRTIIDSMGAEKLLGKGDMLYQNAAIGNPHRIQGTFLSDEEVREIVSDLKTKGKSQYIFNLKENLETPINNDLELQDEVFKEAVDIAKKEGKISTSLIQRRLRIGYNRAARIVELMEEKGIVGSSDGVRPREVLVS